MTAPAETTPDEQSATPPPAPPTDEPDGFGDDLEKWKHFSRENERAAKAAAAREREAAQQRDALQARLNELEDAQKSEHERELDEAVQTARDEVRSEYQSKLRNLAVIQRATGVLADPNDAVQFLDLAGLDPDDAGFADVVQERLDGLLKDKPYLAARSGAAPRFEQGEQGDPPVDIGSMTPEEYRKHKRGSDAVFNRA